MSMVFFYSHVQNFAILHHGTCTGYLRTTEVRSMPLSALSLAISFLFVEPALEGDTRFALIVDSTRVPEPLEF